jgi:hypothetical protein
MANSNNSTEETSPSSKMIRCGACFHSDGVCIVELIKSSIAGKFEASFDMLVKKLYDQSNHLNEVTVFIDKSSILKKKSSAGCENLIGFSKKPNS